MMVAVCVTTGASCGVVVASGAISEFDGLE